MLLAFVLMTLAEPVSACNVCACSSMGNSLGILPQFRSHFIGLRQTNRTYRSSHPGTYINPEGFTMQNHYYNTELWGRYSPFKRIQMFGFIPFNTYLKYEKGVDARLQGLGDPSLIANYVLLNTPDSAGGNFKHALLLGGGVKLGLGAYNPLNEAGFQLGSGSHDALLNASYTLRYNNTGFLSEGFFRINGRNSAGYAYGDKLTGSARLFVLKRYGKMSFLPWAGAVFEHSAADRLKGKLQAYTGGNIQYASLGCDVFAGKFQLGCNTQIPLTQNLGGGLIREYGRLSMFLIYHISTAPKCK